MPQGTPVSFRESHATPRRVAIVGGGPAGASAAAELARAGIETVLFHAEPLQGEKPCGGGVTLKATRAFDWLSRLPAPATPVRRVTIRSPRGREVVVESEGEPFFTLSARGPFDEALRERATGEGARLVRKRVSRLRETAEGVEILAGDRWDRFDAAVAADGAFSPTRRALAPGAPGPVLCPALDWHVAGIDPGLGATLDFSRGLTGYSWVFPRRDLASVGIVARPGEIAGSAMRERLAGFLASRHPGARVVRATGWALPAPDASGPRREWLRRGRVLFAGDAAGLADPLTGEGIFHALESGRLAARALAAGDPARYPDLVEEALGEELRTAARLVARFLRPRALEAMLFAASMHGGARVLVGDLLSGRQRYGDVRARMRGSLGMLAWLVQRA